MLSNDTLFRGRYRVGCRLSSGGMSTVYAALDDATGLGVAIKEVRIGGGEDLAREMRTAFRREARILEGLRHPSLPRVTDCFEEGESGYIVMEFVEGDDLRERQARSERPFDEALVRAWAGQLLDLLDFLHGQAAPVIHRDIKPANLKETAAGRLFLLDFGLAKGLSAETTGRSVHGYTPRYAPPEQIGGRATDARSDLFALGATLFQLVVGAPPPSAVERLEAVGRGHADPLVDALRAHPGVSRGFASGLLEALALDPEARPGSAADMLAALGPDPTRPLEGAPAAAVTPRRVVVRLGGDRSHDEDPTSGIDWPFASPDRMASRTDLARECAVAARRLSSFVARELARPGGLPAVAPWASLAETAFVLDAVSSALAGGEPQDPALMVFAKRLERRARGESTGDQGDSDLRVAGAAAGLHLGWIGRWIEDAAWRGADQTAVFRHLRNWQERAAAPDEPGDDAGVPHDGRIARRARAAAEMIFAANGAPRIGDGPPPAESRALAPVLEALAVPAGSSASVRASGRRARAPFVTPVAAAVVACSGIVAATLLGGDWRGTETPVVPGTATIERPLASAAAPKPPAVPAARRTQQRGGERQQSQPATAPRTPALDLADGRPRVVAAPLASTARVTTDERVFVDPTTATYHRRGCRLLESGAVEVSASGARARYSPCSDCARR